MFYGTPELQQMVLATRMLRGLGQKMGGTDPMWDVQWIAAYPPAVTPAYQMGQVILPSYAPIPVVGLVTNVVGPFEYLP